ncbi:MAG TPA: hypothetical protein VN634_01235 [Candidatus Limnocylindrales bacterium]|nr:hypothetical protein [Candidatus Limnocylindrales bacterium]
MNSARQMLFLLSGAALLTASFSIVPPPALSCGDKDSACACGAACPSMGENPTPGACACGGAGEAAAAGADDHAGGCEHAAALKDAGTATGGLRAVIDPATGQLTAPDGASAAAVAAPAAAAAAEAPRVVEVPQPGGGVMAAVPANRTNHAVATVDENGKAQTGCAE